MKIALILFGLTILGVSGQTWVSRARLLNFNAYFTELMQNLVSELEKTEWCNLKIQNQTVVVNEQMYRWHVSGNVTYANGFLISIQKIDLTNVESLVSSFLVNGTTQASGTVRGLLNFRDADIGFDVIFKPEDDQQRYTGTFSYRLFNFRASIVKNFHTGEITTSVDSVAINAATTRMIFMPANNVTEVLSRRTFVASSISRSLTTWARIIMQPILHQLVIANMEFPSVCFVNC